MGSSPCNGGDDITMLLRCESRETPMSQWGHSRRLGVARESARPQIPDISGAPFTRREPLTDIRAVRGTGVMEYRASAVSLRLDARELDHLGPFLGFGCNESAELGGAKTHWDGADIAEPRPDVRRSQPGIDLAVEPFDDLRWRAGGRADPDPGPRLVSRQRLGDGRHARQQVESLVARDRERAQAA